MSDHSLSRGSLTAAEKLKGVLPAWKVKLIVFFVLAVAGFAALWFTSPPATVEVVLQGSVEARGLAAGPAGGAQGGAAEVRQESWRERIGSWGIKLGVSFLAMLIVGMVLRAFVKILAAVVILVGLTAGGLAYLGVSGKEVDDARKQVESTMTWAEAQANRWKDRFATAVPNALAGLAGLAAGFKKK